MIKLINEDIESSRNIFEILNQIKKILLTIVKKEFNNNQKLIDFVIKRVSGARSVITRQTKIHLTDDEIREWIPSTKAIEGLSRRIKIKSLDNKETYIMTRSSEEDYHYMTSVSRYRIKCTCWDSIYTSSIADKKLFNMMKQSDIDIHQHDTVFSRYSICKHTIASISRAIHMGYLDINDNELLNTLRLSLLGAYLRVEEKPDKELVLKLVSRLLYNTPYARNIYPWRNQELEIIENENNII
ncbi:MAG: hypothetical protein QXK24_00670 [Ignisphaera sp.]